MSEPTNKDRARWALAGIKEFARVVGENIKEEGLETVISDFLADLRHLCDKKNLPFFELDARAHGNYTEEVVGERELQEWEEDI